MPHTRGDWYAYSVHEKSLAFSAQLVAGIIMTARDVVADTLDRRYLVCFPIRQAMVASCKPVSGIMQQRSY